MIRNMIIIAALLYYNSCGNVFPKSFVASHFIGVHVAGFY